MDTIPNYCVFEAKSIRKKYKISYNLILTIPVLQKSMLFKEGSENKFIYRAETSELAVVSFFKWKKYVLDKIDKPDLSLLTAIDWKNLMFMAIHLGDFTFFDSEIGPEFPPISLIIDIVDEFPSEAVTRYVQDYLSEIFCREGNWVNDNERNTAKNSYAISALSLEIFEIVHSIVGDISPDEMMNTTFDEDWILAIKKSFQLEDEMSDEDNAFRRMCWYGSRTFKNEWSKIKSQLLKWNETGPGEKKSIVMAYYDYPGIQIGDDFYGMWTSFFSVQPLMAKLIWNSMDRDELLKVTNVGQKKISRAKKSNYLEMQKYVQTFAPKAKKIDPQEKELRRELQLAKKSNIYDDIEIAEAKLRKYLVEQRKKQQRLEAIKNKNNYSNIQKYRMQISCIKKINKF